MLLDLHTGFSGKQVRRSDISISLRISPQFVVIHSSQRLYSEAEVDVFLEFSSFFYDPVDVGNLISGSSAFSKSSLNISKFLVYMVLKPRFENFEHYLLACGMSATVR